MKKILILLLVFGMSSLANAGVLSLEAYIGGSKYVEGTPVAIGTSVDVYVVQAEFDALGSGGEVWVDFEDIAGATATDLSLGVMSDLYGGWDWLQNSGVAILPAGDFYMGKVPSLGAGTPGLGTVLGHVMAGDLREVYTETNSYAVFNFTTVEDETTVQFSTGMWDGVAVSDSTTIGIPEPMTIALLGLGGLFLRRRK